MALNKLMGPQNVFDGMNNSPGPGAALTYTPKSAFTTSTTNTGGSGTKTASSAPAPTAQATTQQATGGGYAGFDPSGLIAQMNSMYAQMQAQIAAYQAEMQRKAEEAYGRNKENLESSYNNKMKLLGENYQTTQDTLARQRDTSKSEIGTDAERALREAYVNKLLSGKNLRQQLTAQGISGGAAETTMASMQNNYGNARNNIETNRADNLTSLENTYQDNLAAALQQYNTQKAAADDLRTQLLMQIESDLTNALVGSYASQFSSLGSLDNSYLSAMQNLLQQQAAYNYNVSMANNPVSSVTSMAANNGGTGSNYAKWLSVADQLKQAGQSNNSVFTQLVNAGADNNTLQYVMNQLYG